jgi:transcriptional regulator with XRE-family HTH domain
VERVRFGTLLKQHREAAALSQDALAERAGLSLDAVSALESGRSKAPRLETARRDPLLPIDQYIEMVSILARLEQLRVSLPSGVVDREDERAAGVHRSQVILRMSTGSVWAAETKQSRSEW